MSGQLNGRQIAVRKKTVQQEFLSALRRQRKLEEKLERLKAELAELGRLEAELDDEHRT